MKERKLTPYQLRQKTCNKHEYTIGGNQCCLCGYILGRDFG